MANFEIAVAKTIKNEGGDKYTETKDDNGGATKYGISLRFLTDLLETKAGQAFFNATFHYPILPQHDRKVIIQTLTLNQAKEIYKVFFWNANRYGEINDQAIAEKVFDMAVLIGAQQANKILQLGLEFMSMIPEANVDGIVGKQTLYEVNMNICKSNIIYKMKNEYMKYFISICNKKKSQKKFLLDWLNRVIS